MTGTMRAARLHEKGGPLRLDEVPVPRPGPTDVLVKVAACGTQDGDHKLILGKLPLDHLPLTIGHEPVGIVAAIGAAVAGVQEGQRVFVDPSIGCGNCRYCHAGTEQYCAQYAVMGMTCFGPAGGARFAQYKDGGFAEYMKVPAVNLRPLPDALPFEQAAKLAFLGVALKALERARLQAGETVVVGGASGGLGTCTVMAASALGAGEIIAVARDAGRLERVRAVNPGIVVPVSTQDDPELGALRARTGGRGADVYVDCLPSGGIAVTQRCLLGLRAGGRAVLIGGVVGSLDLPYRYFMNQEIEVTGSVGFGRGNFDRIVRLVEAGVVDFSGFVTHRFPLAQANEAIATAVEKTGDPLGVIVHP